MRHASIVATLYMIGDEDGFVAMNFVGGVVLSHDVMNSHESPNEPPDGEVDNGTLVFNT